MIKTLTKVGIEGTFLNIIKAIYDKPTANIILSGKAENLPTKIWNKTRMPTLTTSNRHSIGSTNHSNHTRKRKGIQTGREEIKLSLYADDMMLI